MVLALAVVGVAAVVTGTGASAVWLVDDARRLVLSPETAAPLLGAVEAALALLLARCGLAAALVAATVVRPRASAPGSRSAKVALRVTPRLLRPVVAALLAAGLSTAAGGAALASTGTPALPAAGWTAAPVQGDVLPHLPAAGWVPAPRQAPPAPVHLVAGAAHRPAPPPQVVVRRGDTLWAIVARTLGPRATVARVAAEWPRWYAANRRVIGDDPDLLRPGTTLQAPSRAATR